MGEEGGGGAGKVSVRFDLFQRAPFFLFLFGEDSSSSVWRQSWEMEELRELCVETIE